MEKLVKDKSRASSEAPSSTDTAGGSSSAPTSTMDYKSTTTDYAKLPDHFDMNSSASIAASLILNSSQAPAETTQLSASSIPQLTSGPPVKNYSQFEMTPKSIVECRQQVVVPNHTPGYNSDTSKQVVQPQKALTIERLPHLTTSDTTHSQFSKLRYIPPSETDVALASDRLPAELLLPADVSDIELSDAPDNLSLKVQSLTNNRPGTSTPTRTSPTVDRGHSSGSYNSLSGTKMSAIESENAALRAELHHLSSDRNALRKVGSQAISLP